MLHVWATYNIRQSLCTSALEPHHVIRLYVCKNDKKYGRNTSGYAHIHIVANSIISPPQNQFGLIVNNLQRRVANMYRFSDSR